MLMWPAISFLAFFAFLPFFLSSIVFYGKESLWGGELRKADRPGGDAHPGGRTPRPWEDSLGSWPRCPARSWGGVGGVGARPRPVSPGEGGGCCVSGGFPGRLPALTKTTRAQENTLGMRLVQRSARPRGVSLPRPATSLWLAWERFSTEGDGLGSGREDGGF